MISTKYIKIRVKMSELGANKFPLLIIIVCLISILNCKAQADVVALPQFASRDEQKKLEYQALLGSLEAANKIASVYALVEVEEGLYWEMIAAENGSKIGAHNVASFISVPSQGKNDPYRLYYLERSWFWLKKAADGGDFDAKEELKYFSSKHGKMYSVPEREVKKWVISKRTLSRFKRVAMIGSPSAAYSIYKYCFSKCSSNEKFFWLKIAAQNGYPEAYYDLGSILKKSKNPNDRERSRFWLSKVDSKLQKVK
jgi:hypothetical protein